MEIVVKLLLFIGKIATLSLKSLLVMWRMMLTMSNQSLIVIWMSLFYCERKTNILECCKLNGVKYNVLYEIAKDVLVVPITTVAYKSTFSFGGRHVGPHRSQIHENLLEALMCTQDWLWAEGMS